MLNFVMRSRWHASLVIFLLSLTLFFLPLVFIFAGAIIALATLINGIKEGLVVSLITITLWFILQLTFQLGNIVQWLILFWLPIIIIASLVKQTTNLQIIFNSSIIIGLIYLIIIHLLTDFEPKVFWDNWLQQNLLLKLKNPEITNFINNNKTTIINKLNSSIIIGLILLNWLSIFLARFWQAKLFNPSDFAKEFRSLAMGKTTALILLIIIGLSFLMPLNTVSDLNDLALTLFLLQGVAVTHFWLNKKNIPNFIGVIMYPILLMIPVASLLLSAIGAVDNWLNFRNYQR